MKWLNPVPRILNFKLVAVAAMGLLTAISFAQFSNPANDIPAYHTQPPAAGATLPPILSGNQLTGDHFEFAYQVKIYQLAAKIPSVLYQEPCYCRCDRGMGHQSLRSCFEGTHGAYCSTCMKEMVYTYRQTRLGKSPSQIRDGIERGEWESIDFQNP
jgi:hypothetical protein